SVGMLALDAVRDPVGFDGLIVALSPAQLQWITRSGPGALRPEVSVCLTVDPASDLPQEVFGRVYENTAIACVYNHADEATMHLVEDADVQEGCRAIGVGLGAPGRSDLGMVGDIVVDRAFLDERHSTALELTTHGELAEVDLATAELLPQVLAACAVARALGVSPAVVRTALATFMPTTG
ncbi:MAG TPA: UDP-N-acetylmuramoyl-L-alanine--D-glutamate ligase, partial [Rhodoglobus sp.]|nr:UDP-N-acetylmuramoyl-L-alanine--D-glutamate ligase [Rhodoglobus sp.]